jgi:hypothetical protein
LATRTRNWRRRSAAVLSGLALLAAGACNAAGARVHNLGEIHTDDGLHRYTATLLTGVEWSIRSGLGGMLSSSEIGLEHKDPDKVDDPQEVCLENLVELGRHTGEGGYARSVRIATYARYVVACPWNLSRERCAILLGREGRDIGLAQHPARRLAETTVSADELVGALGELLAIGRPALERRGARADPEKLAQACARVSAFDFDLDGARRALSMVALLAREAPRDDADFACVRDLHAELQRLTVARALSAALVDQSPVERSGSHPGYRSARVRAAAVEGWLTAVGPAALAEFLAQLESREDVDVLLVLMRAVERLGLPSEVAGIPADELGAWRERWTETLVALAIDHPEGRVRVAAMSALSRVSSGSLKSLREEDWLAWNQARRSSRAAAQPSVAAPPAGVGGP